jgi:hypothetical protein
MTTTEIESRRNKQIFMDFYQVDQSKQPAYLENLVGLPIEKKIPIFLDHCSIFERHGQNFCLTTELYQAYWPSEEMFRELDEWCECVGLKYEEVKFVDSWHNPGRCKILMFYKR